MLSRLRLLALAASAVVLTACSSATDQITSAVSVTPGTYALTTMNGIAVPTVLDLDPTILIKSGTITLDANGTYKSEINYAKFAQDVWNPVTEKCSGTYSRSAKGVSFYESELCNGTYGALVSGSTLTVLFQPSLRGVYTLQ